MMNFKELANSPIGEALVENLEEIQAQIADIRYKPEVDNKTRIAVIEIIDEMIINRIKVLRGEETAEGNDNWK